MVTALYRPAAAILLLCLIALAPAGPLAAQEGEAVGQVVQQRGAVTALRTTAARSLHLGAPVFPGDQVITAAQAKVEIEFDDGSTLSVGSGTTIEVVNYSPAARQPGRLLLLIGIIRTSISGLWSNGFEVRTRAAVASVRSTDWVTEAREDRSSVFVVDGAVEVTAAAGGASVLLSEGEGTDVDVGGAPSPPTEWGAARVQDVLERTRVP